MEPLKIVGDIVENPSIHIPAELIKKLRKAKKDILNTNPPPRTKNALKYVFYGLHDTNIAGLKSQLRHRLHVAAAHFKNSGAKIKEMGAKKIKTGAAVFTYSSDPLIIEIFREAKKEKKNFKISLIETQPGLGGKDTAAALSKLNLPTRYYPDLALLSALERIDLVLLKATALTEERVIGETGFALILETASRRHIPVYVCMDSWDFDPRAEFTQLEDIWRNKPRGVTSKINLFEKADSRQITGIISELGIHSPFLFIEELKQKNKWLFS